VENYKELIDALIKRHLGVLGAKKLAGVLKSSNIPVDENFDTMKDVFAVEEVNMLIKELRKCCGAISVLGSRILMKRMAREKRLRLPLILH